MTTCIIIDDNIQIRNRLEHLLLKFETMKVLFKEGIPEKAVEKVLELKPDIVFVDVEMPRMTGFDVVNAVREKKFYPTFIFVTAFNHYAIKAINKGTFGYLLKPVDLDELKDVLERYAQHQSAHKVENIMEIPLLSSLTEREKEVLMYALKGYTSKKTAEMLFISKATVDTHHRKILEKTDEKKISALIIKALSAL